jgi:hypothetical protein
MAAGSVLSVARISVALNLGEAPGATPVRGRFGRGPAPVVKPVAEPAGEPPPATAADPAAEPPRATPVPGTVVDPDVAPPAGATPPTEPTRRL